MKVLLINNGSPYVKGCTYIASSVVESELENNGIETEIIYVRHKDVHGCIVCGKCRETGKCVFNDMVNEVAPKFEQSDLSHQDHCCWEGEKQPPRSVNGDVYELNQVKVPEA